MNGNRVYRFATLALVTGGLAFSLAACGSGDEDPGNGEVSGASATKAIDSARTDHDGPGPTGQTGEFKPEKKAPDSAGDKRGMAPDDVISKRPGGPGSAPPVSP